MKTERSDVSPRRGLQATTRFEGARLLVLGAVALIGGCTDSSDDSAAKACDTDCDSSSSGMSSQGTAAAEGPGGTTRGDETSTSGAATSETGGGDTNDESSSTSGGMIDAHPDGLDPWLPDLDPASCAIEYPWVDAIPREGLTPRTVCGSGCDHTTLTEALEAANPGDEILLEPGDYDECVTVDVSPLVIRGNEGMARFTAPSCEAEQVFKLNGAEIRMSSIEVSDFEGIAIRFGADVGQGVLERLRLDGLNYAVAGSPRELLLRQLKVTNSGYYNESIQHAAAIVSTNPSAGLIVDRSVFSHYRNTAWLFGLHESPYFEMVCSVIAKVAGPEHEANHSFHIYFPGDILLHDNYIQTEARGYHYMYNNGGPPANLVMSRNEFVFEHEEGSFVGNIQGTTVVSAIDNVIVGGAGEGSLSGWTVDEVSGNEYIADRAAAGFEPFPALPSDWPISQL